jgi:hypothetical protein
MRGGSAAGVATFHGGAGGAAAGGEVWEVLQLRWGEEEFINWDYRRKAMGRGSHRQWRCSGFTA